MHRIPPHLGLLRRLFLPAAAIPILGGYLAWVHADGIRNDVQSVKSERLGSEEYILLSKTGSQWVYDDTIERLHGKSTGRITIFNGGEDHLAGTKAIRFSEVRVSKGEVTSAATWYLTRSADGVGVIEVRKYPGEFHEQYHPAFLLLKEPPDVGSVWESNGVLTRFQGTRIVEKLDYTRTTKIVKTEEVIVPAGRFEAIMVSTLFEVRSPVTGVSRSEKVEWRVRNIGKVKEVASSTEYRAVAELTGYSIRGGGGSSGSLFKSPPHRLVEGSAVGVE